MSFAPITRRHLLASAAAASATYPLRISAQSTPVASPAATPVGPLLDSFVIDISGEPDNLTPALTYSTRDWSILHAIYDSLLDFGEDGSLVPLAAESFESEDAVTFRVKLRPDMVFHDGTPVTSAAIARSITHLQEAKSQISEMFATVTEVREIDGLTAELVCSAPSAWLPSQIAVWCVLLPESATAESLATAPVGSGPYVFVSQEAGAQIDLAVNPNYPAGGPKGDPIAERVTYRFVPEPATRVADLTSGAADIIADIPMDQLPAIDDGGQTSLVVPFLGTAFVRIATDKAPFDNPAVCQAVNYALDVQAIADALVSPESKRLASVFPDPRGLGFDETLEPFAYDPEKARTLLAEAGYSDGFDCEFQTVASQRTDLIEAIVAQLAEVGVRATIVTSELAAFNEQWPDENAPQLRFATWRPMYDPATFLRLVINPDGFLSRYTNPTAKALVEEGAMSPDAESRQVIYEELGRELQTWPAAIYLWNLVSTYGLSEKAAGWTPRGDEYILPLRK